MSLERFHEAQADPSASYDTALAEIRAGRKSSHWIWYIFPQIDGLGHSSTARAYALRELTEVSAYLRDPLLRTRYEEIARAVRKQLVAGIQLEELMGGRTDALKLVSSATLFGSTAERLGEENCKLIAQLCASLLREAAAQGYPPCAFTLARLAGEAPE